MFRFLASLALMLVVPLALAGKPPVFATGDGAIRGYDPVAYFSNGQPTRGKPEFKTEWQGATYYFASAENRDRFRADPEAYAPQYGGYCAYAVSQGYTAPVDPNAWKVVDGKLYLNYSTGVQKRWQQDISGHIRAADMHWPSVLGN